MQRRSNNTNYEIANYLNQLKIIKLIPADAPNVEASGLSAVAGVTITEVDAEGGSGTILGGRPVVAGDDIWKTGIRSASLCLVSNTV